MLTDCVIGVEWVWSPFKYYDGGRWEKPELIQRAGRDTFHGPESIIWYVQIKWKKDKRAQDTSKQKKSGEALEDFYQRCNHSVDPRAKLHPAKHLEEVTETRKARQFDIGRKPANIQSEHLTEPRHRARGQLNVEKRFGNHDKDGLEKDHHGPVDPRYQSASQKENFLVQDSKAERRRKENNYRCQCTCPINYYWSSRSRKGQHRALASWQSHEKGRASEANHPRLDREWYYSQARRNEVIIHWRAPPESTVIQELAST